MEFAAATNMFKRHTGRIIALGRTVLAALFFLAIWIDSSQPSGQPTATYAGLAAYLMFALGVLALTWRNWWLDARLAAPALAVDMIFFTLIVFSTHGYTSPYFLMFLLPLLSAAIRWTWRETALVAIVLIILYLAAGILVAGTEGFEHQRFVIRSGQLIVMSAMMIGFSAHQRYVSGPTAAFVGRLADIDMRRDPVEQSLQLAMAALGAGSGALVLRSPGGLYNGKKWTGAGFDRIEWLDETASDDLDCGLFDLHRNRLLETSIGQRLSFGTPAKVLGPAARSGLGIGEGLVARVHTGNSRGLLVLGGFADLSGDYIALGQDIAETVGAFLDRHALVEAVELGAASETRLSLARDVHDNVVQFLASAAFRVEAIARADDRGAPVQKDLADLKRLFVEEQRDIRGFISALRREQSLNFDDSIASLRDIAARLSRQWSLKCSVIAVASVEAIPIQLHLDLQQLLREGVANAARHGAAGRVDVTVTLGGDRVDIEMIDDGRGFADQAADSDQQPWSLKERVERAGGSLTIVTRPGRTSVAIGLPLRKDQE